MSKAEIKREMSALTLEDQNELAAYLLHLRLERDPVWRTDMTRRVDDQTPAQWVSLADWKKELSASE